MEGRNNKGQFTQGNAGRPKGSKSVIEIREQLAEFINSSLPEIIQDYQEAKSARERKQIFFELLPYVLPKLRSTEENGLYSSLSNEDLQRIVNQLKAYYETSR